MTIGKPEASTVDGENFSAATSTPSSPSFSSLLLSSSSGHPIRTCNIKIGYIVKFAKTTLLFF
ncbi:hypothetical protein HanXRQr2_Chr11g0474841 [Helianthus annuus]|uniref:Uncharacterized protein n=1 Tax=Helianthus annuus TaxID=4232 RepID=A0A9K3HLL9_HELAN|nr:hypothetical protein HanXRQr2_Chr11g0474841 [Helianthus annuus]KAJ0873903.1 hypothetical protein HanPSC8_Chr11g0457881 [Helianthus annuus]